MDSMSEIGSSLSAVNRASTFCVVCGKFSEDLIPRDTGLKCQGCVGKRANRHYSKLQHRQLTELFAQASRSSIGGGSNSMSVLGLRPSSSAELAMARSWESNSGHLGRSDESISSFEEGAPLATALARRHSIANSIMMRQNELLPQRIPQNHSVSRDDAYLSSGLGLRPQWGDCTSPSEGRTTGRTRSQIPDYINETSCFQAAALSLAAQGSLQPQPQLSGLAVLPPVESELKPEKSVSGITVGDSTGSLHDLRQNSSYNGSMVQGVDARTPSEFAGTSSSAVVTVPTTRFDSTTRTSREYTSGTQTRIDRSRTTAKTTGVPPPLPKRLQARLANSGTYPSMVITPNSDPAAASGCAESSGSAVDFTTQQDSTAGMASNTQSPPSTPVKKTVTAPGDGVQGPAEATTAMVTAGAPRATSPLVAQDQLAEKEKSGETSGLKAATVAKIFGGKSSGSLAKRKDGDKEGKKAKPVTPRAGVPPALTALAPSTSTLNTSSKQSPKPASPVKSATSHPASAPSMTGSRLGDSARSDAAVELNSGSAGGGGEVSGPLGSRAANRRGVVRQPESTYTVASTVLVLANEVGGPDLSDTDGESSFRGAADNGDRGCGEYVSSHRSCKDTKSDTWDTAGEGRTTSPVLRPHYSRGSEFDALGRPERVDADRQSQRLSCSGASSAANRYQPGHVRSNDVDTLSQRSGMRGVCRAPLLADRSFGQDRAYDDEERSGRSGSESSGKRGDSSSDTSEDEDEQEVELRRRHFSVQHVGQQWPHSRGRKDSNRDAFGDDLFKSRLQPSTDSGSLSKINVDNLDIIVEVQPSERADCTPQRAQNLGEEEEEEAEVGRESGITGSVVLREASGSGPHTSSISESRRPSALQPHRVKAVEALAPSAKVHGKGPSGPAQPEGVEMKSMRLVISVVDRDTGAAYFQVSRLYYRDVVPVFEELKRRTSNLPDLTFKRIPSKKYASDAFIEVCRKDTEEFLSAAVRESSVVRHPRLLQLLNLERYATLSAHSNGTRSSSSRGNQSRRRSASGSRSASRHGSKERGSRMGDHSCTDDEGNVRLSASVLEQMDGSGPDHGFHGRRGSTASISSRASIARRNAMDEISQEELEKAQLGDLIGRGTFGSVYLGLLPSTSMLIAVKIMKVRDQVDEEVLASTQRELDILRAARHTNIIRFLGCSFTNLSGEPAVGADAAAKATGAASAGEPGNRELRIYTEYVECGTVAGMAKRFRGLPLQVIQRYMRQILRGLHYLHEMGIVHRDIKGENMLVTKKGKVKLADFGCSDTLRGMDPAKGLIGSPQWMAPEVLNCQAVGPPVDVWAVGCVGIEMLQRKIWNLDEGSNPFVYLYHVSKMNTPPHGVPTEEELQRHAGTEAYESFAAFRDFLLSCLSVAPETRLTASQLLEHPFLYMPIPKGLRWNKES